MIVWVMFVTIVANGGVHGGEFVSAYHVDNIASAASCEQLAKVVRSQGGGDTGRTRFIAVCAPVRKVKG